MEKTPLSHKLCGFRYLILRPQNLILRSQNKTQIFHWEITSFSKTTLLQKELFSQHLCFQQLSIAINKVFMLAIILSDYRWLEAFIIPDVQFLEAFIIPDFYFLCNWPLAHVTRDDWCHAHHVGGQLGLRVLRARRLKCALIY